MTFPLCIFFSGITVRFHIPHGAELPSSLTDLRCDDTDTPDVEFYIRLLDEPLRPTGTVLHSENGVTEYLTKQGRLRIHHALTAENGCQVACLLRPDEKNTLYYPASSWHFYSHPLQPLRFLAPEIMLIRRNAFLLHSSVVSLHGKTVLFAGSACAGKSTQASLWQKHLGAEILNGDRCVVMNRNGVFYGGGSPWCGTSGIHRPEQFPIAGILLPCKCTENRLTSLGSAAVPLLLSQTLVNSWDTGFMQTLLQLYHDMLAEIPVYRLDCRPDSDAAFMAYRTLFGKESRHGTY
ncbi:MAG: hypothetical protein IJF78_05760 [Clostridia bacterium]|nr:hypothetical protein [Clostridia bacterium]